MGTDVCIQVSSLFKILTICFAAFPCRYANIGATLTPGRNNGFLNMIKVIKEKETVFIENDDVSSSMAYMHREMG